MRLGGTEVGGTSPGAWQERWMEGSLELSTGSGLASCVHVGGERGRCREQTWAWSRPAWRRAEDECSDPGTVRFHPVYRFKIGIYKLAHAPKGAKRGTQHRPPLRVCYLDAQIKEKPQDVDVCRERKVLGVTSGERCQQRRKLSLMLTLGHVIPRLIR